MAINRNSLKKYAPKARQDFIAAVGTRAAKFGISKNEIVPMQEQGDVVIIGGEAFPKKIGAQRKALTARINRHGFDQTVEEVAYTWFNRFLAIRFMEVHGYLDHGYRVLSNPDGSDIPEILQHAEHVDLTGLDKALVVDLKLDGTKDADLYRLLLIAQCNALHGSMPFLFEKIDDKTELLLPDNLLHSDSLIRQLVNEIDEADWQEIEIIGWLYQFYISEKKDQVIGKVVKSEDIPAATQLFTPNWIVKYMVQNSLGHQWMATYPSSSLKGGMEYYIEPAEQTPEVQAQLAEITPKELSPEELTLLDPAAGSGHILVEAYDLFKEIYLERGYRLKDIPRLILEKNMYGLDIDDRAAQMAGFALLMKARADDQRILSNPVQLNVTAIQSSEGLDAADIAKHLLATDTFGEVKAETIESLVKLFEESTTIGSLITVPENIQKAIPALGQLLDQPSTGGLLQRQMREHAVETVRPFVVQANILGQKYSSVIANPPYMGNKYFPFVLKMHLKASFDGFDEDIFSAFIIRSLEFTAKHGFLGFMSPFVWMFISSHEKLRQVIAQRHNLTSLIQLEYSGFEGATVPICTFTLQKGHVDGRRNCFIRLSDFRGAERQPAKTLEAIENRKCGWFYETASDDFKVISGQPIAYWITDQAKQAFRKHPLIGTFVAAKQGLSTSKNEQFVRFWFEISKKKFALPSLHNPDKPAKIKWIPFNKGGEFRKWYGNNEHVVNWENSGSEIKALKPKSVIRNEQYYFKEALSWSDITSSLSAFRYRDSGYIFADSAHSIFFDKKNDINRVLGFLNSKIVALLSAALNPTYHFHVGYFNKLPFASVERSRFSHVDKLIEMARCDWNRSETSWDFSSFPILNPDLNKCTVKASYHAWEALCMDNIQTVKELEEENNRLFIEVYGLEDELTPKVPEDQITLVRADREEDTKRLISYSIGCMMGRYSLAEEGLIYANSGNEGFDSSRYGDFSPDDDGIIPITDTEWFDDDSTLRFEEFLKVAWSPETLKENLKFIGDSLANNGGNDPLKTIRNYLSRGFYKDQLKTYKKRPIYWLFTSGKQRAFECLVYLHRYNEGTLARMRMEYVTPLQSRMSARIDQLGGDVESATSSAERNRKQKEKEKLVKQLVELRKFDEELRYYADQRIALDLDDGVKVNYGKFGNLLAEIKAITGKK